jgi:hypothetical protein
MTKRIASSESKASGKTPAKDSSALPALPRPIGLAAKMMLAGAVGTIVFGLTGIIEALVNRSAWLKAYETQDHLSASQANSGFNSGLIFTIVVSLAAAAVWWWMARATRSGSSMARWVSSVLFLVWTYVTYESISAAHTVDGLVNLIIMLIVWGIGGVAIYQLWLPESSAFFKSSSR